MSDAGIKKHKRMYSLNKELYFLRGMYWEKIEAREGGLFILGYFCSYLNQYLEISHCWELVYKKRKSQKRMQS